MPKNTIYSLLLYCSCACRPLSSDVNRFKRWSFAVLVKARDDSIWTSLFHKFSTLLDKLSKRLQNFSFNFSRWFYKFSTTAMNFFSFSIFKNLVCSIEYIPSRFWKIKLSFSFDWLNFSVKYLRLKFHYVWDIPVNYNCFKKTRKQIYHRQWNWPMSLFKGVCLGSQHYAKSITCKKVMPIMEFGPICLAPNDIVTVIATTSLERNFSTLKHFC